MSMTVKEIKEIISTLSEDTPILISVEDEIYESETIAVEYHSDGRKHLILSNLE